jgi:hypothetical protein
MYGRPLRTLVSTLLLPCLIVAAGCSDQLGNVSGEVKVKVKDAKSGKESIVELTTGSISFASQGRKKKVVTTKVEKGKYAITAVPVGKARVTISGLIGEIPPLDDKTKDGKAKPKPAKSKTPPPVFVNKKYNDPESSGLECEIVVGDQEQNFTVDP